jgi:hypothetical protein
MKRRPVRSIVSRSAVLFALITNLAAPALQAAEPTAFKLIEEGNRHVGEDAKGRVVQTRSEKSVNTLTPNIWYIVYFDPDATAKAAEVKFAAGTKVAVKRPSRVLEMMSSDFKELPKDQLKVDSDEALEIARKEPLLERLDLKASQLKLERLGRGEDIPVWKVRFWAARLSNPNKMADVGEVMISAETGKVVRNELKPDRVD